MHCSKRHPYFDHLVEPFAVYATVLPTLFTDFSPAQELVAACLRLLLRPEILI